MVSRLFFWTLFVAFAVLRVARLESDFDSLVQWGYETFPVGVIAHQLTNTPVVPLLDYADSHSGGQLLSGLLGSLLFRCLGPTYLALKLTGFAFSQLAFVFLWHLLRRIWGTTAAILGGTLFVLAPPTYLTLSLTGMGNHAEVVAFVLLALWAFHEAFLARPDHRDGWTFFFGVASGFAVFYTLSAALVLVALAPLGLAASAGRRLGRKALLVAAGAGLGVAPLVVVNLWQGLGLLEFMSAKYRGGEVWDLGHAAQRMRVLFTDLHPASYTFSEVGFVSGNTLETCAYAIAIASWAGLALALGPGWSALSNAWRPSRWRSPGTLPPFGAVLVLYPLLFAVAYGFSNFEMGLKGVSEPISYRYLLTHHVLGIVTVVAAWSALRATAVPVAHQLATVLAGGSLLLSATVPAMALEGPGGGLARGLSYRGYDYGSFARVFYAHRDRYPPDRLASVLTRLDPAQRFEVYEGLGTLEMANALRFSTEREAIRSVSVAHLLRGHPSGATLPMLHGFGNWLGQQVRTYDKDEGWPGFLELLATLSAPAAGHVVEGMPAEMRLERASRLGARLQQVGELARRLPPKYRGPLIRGLGRELARCYQGGLAREQTLILELYRRTLEAPERRHFLFGLGFGGSHQPDDARMATRVRDDFGPDALAVFDRGLGFRIAAHHDGDASVLETTTAPAERMTSLREGFALYPDIDHLLASGS